MRLRIPCSLAIAATLLAASPARAGLMGYWSFDDGTGTVLTDSSGRGNDGTLSGTSALPTWVAGYTGQTGDYALEFTGSAGSNSSADPYVALGTTSDLAISGNQTISMWLYPTSFASRQNPYNREYGGSGTLTQEPNGSINYYRGSAGADDSPYTSIGSPGLTLNAWNFVTMVQDFDAGIVRWYVNGRTTTQATREVVAGNHPAYIGRGYVQSYTGMIDSTSIWNEALQRSEVIALQESAYTPLQLGTYVRPVDVAGYSFTTTPNADPTYYKDDTGHDLTTGPFTYIGQTPASVDGTVGWNNATSTDILFDLGGEQELDKVLIGYNYYTSWGVGAPDDVQIALSTDGVFDTETFTTYTGFTGTDFRNSLFIDVEDELASYVMLRFDGGGTSSGKYVIDEVAFFAIPEPSAFILLTAAILAIAFSRRRE